MVKFAYRQHEIEAKPVYFFDRHYWSIPHCTLFQKKNMFIFIIFYHSETVPESEMTLIFNFI